MPEINRQSAKFGLPPGTIIHIGERKTEQTVLSATTYNTEILEEHRDIGLRDVVSAIRPEAVTWVDVVGLTDTATIAELSNQFQLHPLTQEDIVNTHQRPKVEDFETYTYIVVRMLSLEGDEGIISEQLSIILAEHLVISFHEQERDIFDAIRDRLQAKKGQIRRAGADYLVYSLLDAVVDRYFSVFEQIGDQIETMEEEVVTNPTPATLGDIQALKRDLIFLRRSIWPLREAVAALERQDTGLFSHATRLYLKDVYDHVIQVADTMEVYREMVGGLLDIYLSSVSNRMNEVMKVLTIIATIFIPLTFIAGIYGMNFNVMPELQWVFGYPAVLLVMLAVGLLMVHYFRRKEWL